MNNMPKKFSDETKNFLQKPHASLKNKQKQSIKI